MGDGERHRHCRRDHASRLGAAGRFCSTLPDGEDVGAELPDAYRDDTDRRRRRSPCPQGVYLCRDRILGGGRDLEPISRASATLASRSSLGLRTRFRRASIWQRQERYGIPIYFVELISPKHLRHRGLAVSSTDTSKKRRTLVGSGPPAQTSTGKKWVSVASQCLKCVTMSHRAAELERQLWRSEP